MQTEQRQQLWSASHRAVDLGDDTSSDETTDPEALDTERSDRPLRVGRRIGPYRLIEEIGRGDIGTVYLAERGDQEIDRRVAVKVLRRGEDTAEILERFRQERQILASLDHPNIARLLDGGATADGLPFFVTEHIQGEPIDRYCARLDLSLERRLRLFSTVCEAIRYAHRNLIVHRDLKPSNILVTADGLVKLVDFGMVRLLAPKSASAPRLSPEFASPEQLRGLPVTTACDVYALGILLYLLLSGSTPLRSLAPRKPSIDAAIRWLSEHELAPPSALANGFARELAGDLDSIALMALEKDPDRRYSSVEQLLADLRRYREQLPVVARRGDWRYRTGKFVRRRRWWVMATTLAWLTVLTLAVTSLG